MRYFNIAGPNKEEQNFGLDPLKRVDIRMIESFIARGRHFLLCSPRQSGKTTFLLAFKKKLNAERAYRCLYCNVEAAQAAGGDSERGIRLLLNRIAQEAAQEFQDPRLYQNYHAILERTGPDGAILAVFERWLSEEQPPKPPLVLMLDGIDLLSGRTLTSILRQLRVGQGSAPRLFPQSVILSAVRDIRDADVNVGSGEFLTGRSGTDIREPSVTLYDFTRAELKELCDQHTAETGQVFQEGVYPRLYALSGGRPWLVNALLCEALYEMNYAANPSKPITAAILEAAKDHFIARQDAYLDQLATKLSSPQVREVLFPILSGTVWKKKPPQDVLEYLKDLELIKKFSSGWSLTNAIAKELIPRVLGRDMRDELLYVVERGRFIKPDKRLNLLSAIAFYQTLYRDRCMEWETRYDLKGAFPQILLQAFLLVVLGDRGRMECECMLASGRVDIGVSWFYPVQSGEPREERFIIRLQIFDNSQSQGDATRSGAALTAEFAHQRQAHEAFLLLLDESSGRTWYDRLYQERHVCLETPIYVFGL
ncbi:MAG: ATP-binding protein [Synergistaceae bacterium]|jgi:DNA polymerase III delta prime subunit|nr:ATP-binding protein [Synergistaceae bacterium]